MADLTEHLAKAIAELPAETLGRPAINLPWRMDEIAANKMQILGLVYNWVCRVTSVDGGFMGSYSNWFWEGDQQISK